MDCTKDVHLTAQISSNPKNAPTRQESLCVILKKSPLWQSLTLTKCLSSRLHLCVQAPKAVIQHCICAEGCSLRFLCSCKTGRQNHGTGLFNDQSQPQTAASLWGRKPLVFPCQIWMYLFGVVSLVPAAPSWALTNCT